MLETLARYGWSFGIGDPYPMGWIIFVGYFIASALCLRKGVSIRPSSGGRDDAKERIMWFGLCVMMLLLGLNKQLDLQVLLRAVGRMIAHSQGWFDMRREVQKVFLVVIAVVGTASLAIVFGYLRRQMVRNIFVVVGILLAVSFILIRAASFSHVDVIPAGLRAVSPRNMKYILESSGIVCICYAALSNRYKRDRF